ncbi:hypothetical protein [Schlesneria sp. T3-172]|uniref:ATP-binding protein n=1 Tax=Schlesneria sphaerica TaxID=3373610 RepID=UPI0037CACA0A
MISAVVEPGIVINNIGPIEHLELAAKPGTITVLRGCNGRGKSTALEAIDALTRGEARLESRDGTIGGTAIGFGVQIKVGRGGTNRRTGDLLVTAVEDKLSIADFVDPNVKDPVAADGKRLKALVALAGLQADPKMFECLTKTPAEFLEIVKPESLAATDPVELAAKIKRDFESASRLQSQRAERLFGEVKSKLASLDGLDLNAEHDREVLQQRLETAIREQSALKERLDAAGRTALARQQAEAALNKAVAGYTGQSVKEAADRVDRATEDRDSMARVVTDLENKLREAKADLQAANTELSLAVASHESAKSHEAAIAGWRETLEATNSIEAPSEATISAAAAAVEAARKASETGVLVRNALARKSEAEELDAQRAAAVQRAEFLRDAAASTLDVLANGVKSLVPGLKLDEQLRIIVPHPIRTECYYADLSHGERWRLALDLAVAAFKRKGQRGVLAVPQEAWESLDGPNRKIIADHVSTTDLIVFTAESSKSFDVGAELEAEVI